jgi:hypothetical protein
MTFLSAGNYVRCSQPCLEFYPQNEYQRQLQPPSTRDGFRRPAKTRPAESAHRNAKIRAIVEIEEIRAQDQATLGAATR